MNSKPHPKTDEEWRAYLRAKDAEPLAFEVTRRAATERPFTGKYETHWEPGQYHCVCCEAKLFDSSTKFDAGCGWPSFYDASNNKNVILRDDLSHGMIRTEVLCGKCNGHLGHLFKGEGFDTPKDQRYCINGVTLLFVPEGGKKPEEKK